MFDFLMVWNYRMEVNFPLQSEILTVTFLGECWYARVK